MSQQVIIVILGFWIALVPFLGFPGSWKTFFIVISSLIIAGLSLLMVAKQRFEESQQALAKSMVNHDSQVSFPHNALLESTSLADDTVKKNNED